MHQYATDSEEKKLIFLILALMSIATTWILYEVVTHIGVYTGWVAPWWLEIPSVLTFYGLFYELFDKWLWKKRILRRLGLVHIPDLNGTWKGSVESHDFGKLEAHVKIMQTWTHIGIFQETKTSKGFSYNASLHIKDLGGTRLFFMYRNVPEIDADPNMRQHVGSAQLVLSPDEKTLNGDYYNCVRDRPTFGKLHFERS
jgi:hypothetical protein